MPGSNARSHSVDGMRKTGQDFCRGTLWRKADEFKYAQRSSHFYSSMVSQQNQIAEKEWKAFVNWNSESGWNLSPLLGWADRKLLFMNRFYQTKLYEPAFSRSKELQVDFRLGLRSSFLDLGCRASKCGDISVRYTPFTCTLPTFAANLIFGVLVCYQTDMGAIAEYLWTSAGDC